MKVVINSDMYTSYHEIKLGDVFIHENEPYIKCIYDKDEMYLNLVTSKLYDYLSLPNMVILFPEDHVSLQIDTFVLKSKK